MKCCIMQHFIWVCIVLQRLNNFQGQKYKNLDRQPFKIQKWTIPYLLYQYVPDTRVKAVITPQRGHSYDIFVFTNLKKIKE